MFSDLDRTCIIVFAIVGTIIVSSFYAITSWGERTYTIEYFECHNENRNEPFKQVRCVNNLPNKGLKL